MCIYLYQVYAFYSSFSCSRIEFCKKHHEYEPSGMALIQFSQWQKNRFGLTGILKYHQRMYLKIRDRIEYMINTSSNFEMFGILLCWYSVSAPSGKSCFYSAGNGVQYPRVPCGSGLWYSPTPLIKYQEGNLIAVAASEDVDPSSAL